MNTNNGMLMQNNIAKRLGIWALVVTGILMIPFITNAPWTASDYIFSGIVLFGAASAYEFVTKSISSFQQRMIVAGIVFLAVFLVWGWAVA